MCEEGVMGAQGFLSSAYHSQDLRALFHESVSAQTWLLWISPKADQLDRALLG